MQLPKQSCILWKSDDRTCFEIKVGAFSMTFLMCMSGSILCLISIDQYITIVKRKHYKRTTNRSLTIPIILVILFSFMWVTFEAHYKAKLDIKKTAKLYFALSGHTETVMTLVAHFNVSLLRHVKQRRKSSSLKANMNSFKQQAVYFHFIKNNSNYCGYHDSYLFTNNDHIRCCIICINKFH